MNESVKKIALIYFGILLITFVIFVILPVMLCLYLGLEINFFMVSSLVFVAIIIANGLKKKWYSNMKAESTILNKK